MALVVVLLFLLAATGITIYSMKRATFSEGASRNELDSQVARQAAEAALRDAERDLLLSGTTKPVGAACMRGDIAAYEAALFAPACPKGLCSMNTQHYASTDWSNPAKAEPWWPNSRGGLWGDASSKPSRSDSSPNCDFSGSVPLGTFTGTAALPSVSRQPEYIVERINRNSATGPYYFRITARGFGQSEATQTVLQTFFVPFDQ